MIIAASTVSGMLTASVFAVRARNDAPLFGQRRHPPSIAALPIIARGNSTSIVTQT